LCHLAAAARGGRALGRCVSRALLCTHVRQSLGPRCEQQLLGGVRAQGEGRAECANQGAHPPGALAARCALRPPTCRVSFRGGQATVSTTRRPSIRSAMSSGVFWEPSCARSERDQRIACKCPATALCGGEAAVTSLQQMAFTSAPAAISACTPSVQPFIKRNQCSGAMARLRSPQVRRLTSALAAMSAFATSILSGPKLRVSTRSTVFGEP